jgi:hypothetical protein
MQTDIVGGSQRPDETNKPQVILDRTCRVRSTNRAFLDLFGLTREMAEGRVLFTLGERNWESPELLQAMKQVMAVPDSSQEVFLSLALPEHGHADLHWSVNRLETRVAGQEMLRLSVEILPAAADQREKLSPSEVSQRLAQVRPELEYCLAQIAGYSQVISHHPDAAVQASGQAIRSATEQMLNTLSGLFATSVASGEAADMHLPLSRHTPSPRHETIVLPVSLESLPLIPIAALANCLPLVGATAR